MTPGQEAGIADLTATFGPARVTLEELGDGRLWVTLVGADIGAAWNVPSTPISTVLEVSYPTPTPYPFYARDGLTRVDGTTVSGLTSSVEVLGRRLAQLSLKKDDQVACGGLGAHFMAVVAWLRRR